MAAIIEPNQLINPPTTNPYLTPIIPANKVKGMTGKVARIADSINMYDISASSSDLIQFRRGSLFK